MLKAVILDGYTLNPGDLDWRPLTKHAQFKIYDRTAFDLDGFDLIVGRAREADIVITNKTPLTKEVIDELPNLKYIGLLSTGYDVVDIEAAKERNITVTNIPGYSTASVAQLSIALLLELCQRAGHHNHEVKQGRWSKNTDFSFWDYPLVELSGKTMGIIGYGSIGQVTARIAQALGMNVLAWNRTKDKVVDSENLGYASLEELYEKSDVISLHIPLTKEMRGFINKETIAKMKDGVFIINTARGGLINEEDLAEALNSGKVAGAGVDVVSEEPIPANHPLLIAKNSIITPHIAWASKDARGRLMDIAANNLKKYLESQPVNVVNG